MTLDHRIAALHAEGRLRVWSLAVTYFGDAAHRAGGAEPVPLSDLTAVLGRLGAEPGAVRTAMSRLAKEGWVERERAGRRSFYRLSAAAMAETTQAARRIYAEAPGDWDGGWTVAMTADVLARRGSGRGAGGPRSRTTADIPALTVKGFHRIAPGLWLAPSADAAKGAAPRHDLFLISGGAGDAPDWLKQTLSPAPLAKRYHDFAAAWRGFEPPEDALDRTAARTLLVHDWRRALLRDAALPRALRPEGWPGAAARGVFRGMHKRMRERADGSGRNANCDQFEGPPLSFKE